MKVKNIAFSGFMASILMAGAAYAEGAPTLATDQYVIQGVNYAISQAQDYTDDVIGIDGLPENTTVTGYIESAVNAAETAINAKQNKIDSDHKLSAGLVDGLANVATTGAAANITDDATHRFVTDTEKSAWNAKQDALPATSGNTGKVLKVGASGLEWADDANSQYDDSALAGRVKVLEDTGVTADKISAIASNTAAIASNASAIAEKQTQLNATQLAAVNSGIDETKVGKYDAYNTTLTELTADITELDSKKQATIDADNKLSASLVSGLATVATSGNASDLNNDLNFQSADDVTTAIVLEVSDHNEAPGAHEDIREDISGLQDAADALNDDILELSADINATNTGLKARMTAAETSITNLGTNKANATDVYTKAQVDTALEGKQASLSEGQLAAANSGATKTKIDSYDAHLADNDIHVTAAQKTAWSGKQDAISDLSTIRSGAAAGATALQNSCGSGYCLVTPTGGMVSITTVSENSQWGSTTGGSGTN